MTSVLDRIRDLLKDRGISFKEWHHAPVRTSEEAARVRGVDLKLGAKSMVLKADDQFVMCVLSAAKRIDSKKVKQILGVKSVRFASPEELKEVTGCEPGGVPPFGNVFGLGLLADRSLLENECVEFNAGSVSDSMELASKDYARLVEGTAQWEDFSE